MVSTQTLPWFWMLQACLPPVHVQTPDEQVSPALQAFPQPPQLLASVEMSTQPARPQATWP